MLQPDKEYLDFLANGQFMLLRDKMSGRHIFFPRVAAPMTGSTELEWVAASGEGVVYSTSVMRERNPAESYNVALIDLAEGPRMMSRVEGIPPEHVTIGMRVKARIIRENDDAVVVFDPIQQTAGPAHG